MKFISVIYIAIVLSIALPSQAARFNIDINNPGFRKIAIQIHKINNDKYGISKRVFHDLSTTGLFNVIYSEIPINFDVNHTDLVNSSGGLGGSYLLYGSVDKNKDGLIKVRFVQRSPFKEIFARLYKTDSNPSGRRWLAHRIADDIFKSVFGSYGPFESLFAFSLKVGNNREIYISEFDGSGLIKITNYKSLSYYPRWLGRSTIYFSSLKGNNIILYKYNISNGNIKVVSNLKGLNIGGDPSDNGKQIVYSSPHGNAVDIYLLNTVTGKTRRLTNDGSINVSPALYKNNLIYTSNRYGEPQIFMKNLKTGHIKRLTYHGRYNTSPSLSHDHKKIAFVSRRNGSFNIATINTDGSGYKVITEGFTNVAPAWSPGDKFIAFVKKEKGVSSVYLSNQSIGQTNLIFSIKGDIGSLAWSGLFR